MAIDPIAYQSDKEFFECLNPKVIFLRGRVSDIISGNDDGHLSIGILNNTDLMKLAKALRMTEFSDIVFVVIPPVSNGRYRACLTFMDESDLALFKLGI